MFLNSRGYAECKPWKPVVVSREAIAAEIERLAEGPLPAGGRRAAAIVHPEAAAPGLGFAPGIDVTINVLRPGEATVPLRRNSNQLEICIRGGGIVTAGERAFAVEEHDIWNVPAMQTYAHQNTGRDIWARLSYSNAWSDHSHSYQPSPEGTVSLTVQDHPLHIAMESLIWQEDLSRPILTLGSQGGVKGYVGPRVRGA